MSQWQGSLEATSRAASAKRSRGQRLAGPYSAPAQSPRVRGEEGSGGGRTGSWREGSSTLAPRRHAMRR